MQMRLILRSFKTIWLVSEENILKANAATFGIERWEE